MGNVRLRTWSQVTAVAFIILAVSFVPGAFASNSHAASIPAPWSTWAPAAWTYFQSTLNPTTGMTADACAPAFTPPCWAFFTYWGLASNIFAVINAHQLGLLSDTDFLSRITAVLTSLNSISLDPNTGVPYGVYSRDTLQQATGSPSFDTNAADYGRYLIAMYVLKQNLNSLSPTLATKVTSDVSRVTGNSNLAGTLGSDLYSYYVSLGFMLWGINPSATSAAQNGFQNLMQNGPFLAPSSMYGVSGIPTNTRIDGEPLVDAILEVGNLPQVSSLPSWCNFLQLAWKVYKAQENRSAALSNTPQFWTGGGLDFKNVGFVSEWIVWTTGQTWVTLDQSGNPFNDPRLPVAYVKLVFAYNALYGTTYTSNFLNTYAISLEFPSYGFEEGIYANAAIDTNVQVQTQQIVLSSAVMATLTTQNPDFCLCMSPSSQSIAPGATASYTVTGLFLGGFSAPVTLSAASSLPNGNYSFNPTTINSAPPEISPSSRLSTTQGAKRGTFTITVTGTSGAITHTATVLLTIITPLSLLSTVLLNAAANSVYFIFPDGNTAHPKPAGVGYASVTDWTALGFVYGSLTEYAADNCPGHEQCLH